MRNGTEAKLAGLAGDLPGRADMLQKILDALPLGLWVVDTDGKVVLSNRTGLQFWRGGDAVPHDGLGIRAWHLDGRGQVARHDLAVNRALREGQKVVGELVEAECQDHSRKILRNSAIPLYDEQQELCGAVVAYEDVTESYHTEEALRVNREFFQRVFDSAAVGMAITDPQGRFLMVNAAVRELFGYSEDELLSLATDDIAEPVDQALSEQQRARLVSGQVRAQHVEKRYRHKSGSDVWVLQATTLVRDQGGAAMYFVVQMVDITPRKLAESRLQESESNLANAQAQVHLGSWSLDFSANKLIWSDETYRIFGIDPATSLDYQVFLSMVHPQDRMAVETAWAAALQGAHYDIEHRIMAHGRVKWVRERAELEFDAHGELVRGVGTVQDITELKEQELELRDSRQMLRELAAHQESIREEERSRIAHEVHDELGQQLTALKLDVSLLRLKYGELPGISDKLDEMRQLVERTIMTVRHVASNLRPAALDLGLVAALEWLIEEFGRHADIDCVLHVLAREVPVEGEQATAVFRIVQESLTNVRRHSGANEVEIALNVSQGQLQVRVTDNGVGFDPAVVRSKHTFGLFGMRERALFMGGSLRIDSVPGAGTTVLIQLPLTGGM
jgi:PAS domain S-box-containing protein